MWQRVLSSQVSRTIFGRILWYMCVDKSNKKTKYIVTQYVKDLEDGDPDNQLWFLF